MGDYTSTERSRRRRARLREEKRVAEKAAKVARRVELDFARIARGLPLAKSSTERARETRARKAAAEATRWYAPGLTELEARAFLEKFMPNAHENERDVRFELAYRGAHRYELNLNGALLTKGVEYVRTRRAIHEQIIEAGGDLEQANQQTDIKLPDLHPSQQERVLLMLLEVSQAKWRQGDLVGK